MTDQYEQIDFIWQGIDKNRKKSGGIIPAKNELIALVSLIRRVVGIDSTLTSYDKTVDANFKKWIFDYPALFDANYLSEYLVNRAIEVLKYKNKIKILKHTNNLIY